MTTATTTDAGSGEIMIDLEDVHVRLNSEAGEVHILKGISLSVPAGEVAGVVGPSGSGKSTMMLVTGGLESASAGRVTVAGRDITHLSEDQLSLFRRDTVGIVFQNFHLVPTMTALENVAIPLELAGRADAFEVARQALESVRLGHRLTHYPGQLSGGEQQRVALARAFAPNPKVILADEPTGNLDQETGEHVIALLFERVRQTGATCLLITHDPGLAARCDRQIQLIDGQIGTVTTGRPVVPEAAE